MARGKFEENIANKFSGEGISPPPAAWDAIQSKLDAGLIAEYSKKNRSYRWLSIAAMIIALISIANQLYIDSTTDNQDRNSPTYNALTNGDYKSILSSYKHLSNNSLTTDNATKFIYVPESRVDKSKSVLNRNSQDSFAQNDEEHDPIQVLTIDSKQSLELAEVTNNVYLYRNPNYLALASNRKRNKTANSKLWAGLNASTGTFNPDFDSDNPTSLMLNSNSIASFSSARMNNPSAVATQNSMQPGTTRAVGMNIGVRLGNKWSIEGGLTYANIESQGSANINVYDIFPASDPEVFTTKNPLSSDVNVPLSNSDGLLEVENSLNEELPINNNIQFATVPLTAGYFLLDKKFILRINAGLSANYFLSNTLNSAPSQTVFADATGNFNTWYFDGIGGVEVGYTLFDKFNLTLEPNYRQSLSPLSNSVSAQSGFNIRTGIRYNLN